MTCCSCFQCYLQEQRELRQIKEQRRRERELKEERKEERDLERQEKELEAVVASQQAQAQQS